MEKILLQRFEDLVIRQESNEKFKEQAFAMKNYDNFERSLVIYERGLLELLVKIELLQVEIMLKQKRKKLFGLF